MLLQIDGKLSTKVGLLDRTMIYGTYRSWSNEFRKKNRTLVVLQPRGFNYVKEIINKREVTGVKTKSEHAAIFIYNSFKRHKL